MVFESIIADILNKFIGDYIENLDRSQLKIGIWGGDVVLNDLILKQSALDELDLPVKTVFGRLGKLVLKIPWKNIYNSPVEASVKDLYLLVIPLGDVKYDEQKEEKFKESAKQAELQKVELAKIKEKEKDKGKTDDTFTEKLTAQIIRNVQICIENIHIRYEDKITNVSRPFACGFTLHKLALQTTNDITVAKTDQQSSPIFFKIMSLDGFAIYWNTKTFLFSSLPENQQQKLFNESIATSGFTPNNDYVLGPINATARLKLNMKPETTEFVIPKISLTLELKQLSIGLSRLQYQDIIAVVETMDRMATGAPYRKYRPDLNDYKGNYSLWWKFAINCVMEETVKPQLRNWHWQHISKHRNICRKYFNIYKEKLTKKLTEIQQNELKDLEHQLDVFNIILIRQCVENEVEKDGLKEAASGAKKGWFGGWWSGGKAEETSKSEDLLRKLENAMTDDEKKKLYQAIDYQENAAAAEYPNHFVATELHFQLNKLYLIFKDDTKKDKPVNVVTFELCDVITSVKQRPAARGLTVNLVVELISATGLSDCEGEVPQLIKTKLLQGKSSTLLDVLFESNPLDGTCDQRLHVALRPLKVVYDAETIISVIHMFTPDRDITQVKNQIQAAANSKIAEMKKKSALGLQYAIEKSTRFDLKIDFRAPYLIIPYGGRYTRNTSVIVLNLGKVEVESKIRDDESEWKVSKLARDDMTEQEVVDKMMLHCYDKFTVHISEIQVLVAAPGERWNLANKQDGNNSMHILHPTDLIVNVEKCLIDNDARLPKIRMTGVLPDITVNVVEKRLMDAIGLLLSIPLPESDESELEPEEQNKFYNSALSLKQQLDSLKTIKVRKISKEEQVSVSEGVEFTNIEASFQLSSLSIRIQRNDEQDVLLEASISSLELKMVQKTDTLTTELKLRHLSITQTYQGVMIPAVMTAINHGSQGCLFSVKFIMVDRQSPLLHSQHHSVVQLIGVKFTKLYLLAHQEAILNVLAWIDRLKLHVESIKSTRPIPTPESIVTRPRSVSVSSKHSDAISKPKLKASLISTVLSTISEEENEPDGRKSVSESRVQVIDLKITGEMEQIQLSLQTASTGIATMDLNGFQTNLIMKRSYTQINASLKSFSVINPNTSATYTKMIYYLPEEKELACNVQFVMYNNDVSNKGDVDKPDMSISLRMSCVHCVFISHFVNNIMGFVNNFEKGKEMIVEASSSAVASAAANMQQVYESSSKISLDILIIAPIVIIPENSESLEKMILHLGKLTLRNKFISIDKGDHVAVIDDIHAQLDDIKVCRSVDEIRDETTVLLNPVSCSVKITRNLCANWYDEIADVDIKACLHTIHASISDNDYQLMLRVLNEVSKMGTQVQEDVVPDKTTIETVALVSNFDLTEDEDKNLESCKTKIRVSLKFSVQIKSAVLQLSTIPKNNTSEQIGLAKLTLSLLSAKGSMLSDGSMSASVLLLDCLLDDTRPYKQENENTVTRYMNSKGRKNDETKSMIDVTFRKKQLDTFVDVRVFSFELILNLEHILKLQLFFNDDQLSKDISTSRNNVVIPHKETIRKDQNEVIVDAIENKMWINISLEEPDIILVENLDSVNTKAIIFNNEVSMKIFMSSNTDMSVKGVVKNMQLYTCCYAPQLRQQTTLQVLYPVDISVDVVKNASTLNCMQVDITFTPIVMSVTPNIIELICAILQTLNPKQEEEIEQTVILPNYSDLWKEKSLSEDDHWFLMPEEACDAEYMETITVVERQDENETMLINAKMDKITITIYSNSQMGNTNMASMLMVESSFQVTAKQYQTYLMSEGKLSLQISYYNNKLSIWQYLMEPILEDNAQGPPTYRPWMLQFTVRMNNASRIADVDGTLVSDDLESIQSSMVPSALTTVLLSSKERMELTISKGCLQVLKNIFQSVESSVIKSGENTKLITTYNNDELMMNDNRDNIIIRNEFGLNIIIFLNEQQSFILGKGNEEKKQILLEESKDINLIVKEEKKKDRSYLLTINIPSTGNRKIDIRIGVKSKKMYYPGQGNNDYGVVADIDRSTGTLIVTLRTIINVYNHLNADLMIYYHVGDEVSYVLAAQVPKSLSVNLPVQAIYSKHATFNFAVPGHKISKDSFKWAELKNNLIITKQVNSISEDAEDKDPFFMQVVGEMQQIHFENTERATIASRIYDIHVYPTVTLSNHLPYQIVCHLQGLPKQHILLPGQSVDVTTAEPDHSTIIIKMDNYRGQTWTCKELIDSNKEEFSVWPFHSYSGNECDTDVITNTLNLAMWTKRRNSCIRMVLYCPIWMVNKTNLDLYYKVVHKCCSNSSKIFKHERNLEEPILFSSKEKSFFGKKNANVKVGESGDWSNKFSLDVAGSSGCVTCSNAQSKYPLGISNKLNYDGLTKQVIFTPYYVFTNNCPYAIEILEKSNNDLIKLSSEECRAFWPTNQHKEIKVRVLGTDETSASFSYNQTISYLLPLNNKFGGINVQVQVTEGGTYLHFAPYKQGMANVLIINHTDNHVSIMHQLSTEKIELQRKHELLFNWPSPPDKPILILQDGAVQVDLRKDGIGELVLKGPGATNDKAAFWITFLDGMQRTLLLTEEMSLAKEIRTTSELEQAEQDISISIEGIGLSLVDDDVNQEILYVSIAGCGTIWQTQRKSDKAFKSINKELNELLEDAFNQYNVGKDNDVPTINPVVSLNDGKTVTVVNLETLTILSPTEKRIRRTHNEGLWLQMIRSAHYNQIHGKIHKLQVDNQIYDCVFPVVFACVPPPKSIALKNSTDKPFFELSIVERLSERSNVRQYNYFKVLVQEFHVRVEIAFINSLTEFFEQMEVSDEEQAILFENDRGLVKQPLIAHISVLTTEQQKDFFDLLHLSPFKIHVSFSLSAGSTIHDDFDSNTRGTGNNIVDSNRNRNRNSTPAILNLLTASIGVTLTDINDILFKLGYFERQYEFLSQKELLSQVQTHYVGQLVKQLYVLVLGLDVIGNPFGLVTGIKQGVEDFFYEPFQGAIQGPSEFAEGLMLGVRSLFGHTVGGAAGAVGKITGAMGKGIAALTLDEEYQRKRRQNMYQPQSMKQSGQGLIMGVVEGVGGVVAKPISGAREEGVEGFFKGVGKGVVGLFARPASGVVDFASGTVNAVKRVATHSEEVDRCRLPRWLNGDGSITVYSKKQAYGYKLLMELDKGRYGKTDKYVWHVIMPNTLDKEILLFTDNRLMYIYVESDCSNTRIEWQHPWIDIDKSPSITDKGITIPIKTTGKSSGGIFASNKSKMKLLLIHRKDLAQIILKRIENIMNKVSS